MDQVQTGTITPQSNNVKKEQKIPTIQNGFMGLTYLVADPLQTKPFVIQDHTRPLKRT